MRALRIGWRCARLGVHLLLGVSIVLTVFRWLSAATRAQLIRWWSRDCLAICGVGFDVRDLGGANWDGKGLGGCLVVANHVSWLDIVVLNAVRPMHFIAKSEIRGWPVLGTLTVSTGTIFIERGRRHAVHDVIRKMVGQMRAGTVCAVFPEGTTSDGRGLLPFHANLIEAALEAQAPVLPLAVRYLDHEQPSVRAAYYGEDTLIGSVARVLGAPGLVVHVRIGAALLPEPGMTRHALADRAHAAVGAMIGLSSTGV